VDEYADESCATTGTADWSKWDDWNGGSADDATTFNCGVSTAAWKQISQLSALTLSGINGVYVRARCRANIASKTVTTYMIIRDSTPNEQEKINPNLASTTWFMYVGQAFDVAPDGGAWTQAKLDDTRLGVRTIVINGAHDQWTAIFMECFAVDDDPPAAAGADRRRLLASVV